MAKGNSVEKARDVFTSRREILRSFGVTGGLSAVGTIGVVSGTEPPIRYKEEAEQARKPFSSADAANEIIRRFGGDLIMELSDQGILETSDVSRFTTNTLLTTEERTADKHGVYVTSGRYFGQISARISSINNENGYGISLFLHPQADKYYAIAESTGDISNVLIVEKSGEETITMGCHKSSNPYCTYEIGCPCCCPLLGCVWTEYERYECYPSGDCYPGSQTECCSGTDTC